MFLWISPECLTIKQDWMLTLNAKNFWRPNPKVMPKYFIQMGEITSKAQGNPKFVHQLSGHCFGLFFDFLGCFFSARQWQRQQQQSVRRISKQHVTAVAFIFIYFPFVISTPFLCCRSLSVSQGVCVWKPAFFFPFAIWRVWPTTTYKLINK